MKPTIARLVTLLMLALASLGCCALRIHHTPAPRISPADVAAQTSFPFGGRTVYVFGQDSGNPPVLLLHELPGFTPQAWHLAQKLAADGFTVYVPVLFGDAGATSGQAMTIRIILSPQWHVKRRHETAPIEESLLALADEIHDHKSPGKPLGVIGMCLTGNLAVPILARRPFVNAAVVSQPSLPFCDTGDIALSAEDIAGANARRIPFLFFRFDHDEISAGKLAGFQAKMPGLVDAQELPDAGPAGAHHFRHAVLTSELFDAAGGMIDETLPCNFTPSGELSPDSLTPHCAYAKVVRYFRARLGGKVSQ